MPVERTLVLIKPDAVARGLAGEILSRFEARGLAMRAGRLLTVDRGRFLSDSDVEGERNYCVLAAEVADSLYPFGEPIVGKRAGPAT